MRATTVRMGDEMWEAMERERGDLSRNRFILELLEEELDVDAGIGTPGRPVGSTNESLPPRSTGKAQAQSSPFTKIKGFWWANMDDAVQRAQAIMAWLEQDRSNPPDPLPYRPSAGEDPQTADVETRFSETAQMWAWVDGYLR